MTKFWGLIICLALFSNIARAQVEPLYTNYYNNLSFVNPAYVSDDFGLVTAGLLHRQQWVGVKGAPTTTSFFVHKPILQRLEAGVNVVTDQIGDNTISRTIANVDLAYIAHLSDATKLSFGLKYGISSYNVDFTALNDADNSNATDPLFANPEGGTFNQLGVGLFLFSQKFYMGVSLGDILLSSTSSISESSHLYFITGKVIELNKDLMLRPSLMFRTVGFASYTADIQIAAMYKDLIEVGLAYRLYQSVIAMAKVRVTPYLKLGYSYDNTTSSLGPISAGTHEFMLLFDFFTWRKCNCKKKLRFF